MHYYATFTKNENGGYFVEFRDLDKAYTQGDDFDDALMMAKDVLLTAFAIYVKQGEPIPLPSPKQGDEVAVFVDLCTVAKILFHNKRLKSDVTNAELARRLNIAPQNVPRFTDFFLKTKIEKLEQAFNALGYELSLSVTPKAPTP